MKTAIKLILAALLLGCLAHMPYSYYQFIRVACCAGFAYLAYVEFESERNVIGLLYVGLAILLNPIAKIHFIRGTWNEIDLVIAIALIIWTIIELSLRHGKSSKQKSEA